MRFIKGWLVASVIAASTTLGSQGSAQPPVADAGYQSLANTYFARQFEANPSVASDAGIHDYDSRLDDLTPGHYAAQLAQDEDYLAKLEAIDAQSLSAEVRIDRQMLIWSLKDDLLVNGTESNWQHNPDLYTQVASDAVYSTIVRNYAPLSVRMRYTIAREQQIPRLLSQAEKNITTVDAATAEVSYEDTAGSQDFFATDVPMAFQSVQDASLRRSLALANAAALRALKSYTQWIKAGPLAHPAGTFAIGKDAYQQRLLNDDALTMPVDRYLAIGEQALATTQAQFIAVAHRVDPKHTPREVYEALSLKHPPARELLPAAQQDITNLRTFVVGHRVITVPSDADIKVVTTPAFAQSQTFAAFNSPGPLEKVATQAYYWVTPPDPSWPHAEQEKMLGFLNDYARPLVSAHEVMPGHFINYAIDKHLDLSLTRKLLWNPEFGEGWAHYDEQMVVDEGWGNGDPRVRLAQLAAALTREGRYIIGVKEHTQGMTVDQATAFLVKNAYMPEPNAHREALRGTQDPMYGYYTLGKLMILKLRGDYQKKMGSRYTLEAFHDALLAHGDPPIPLLRPILLGSDDDGKAL